MATETQQRIKEITAASKTLKEQIEELKRQKQGTSLGAAATDMPQMTYELRSRRKLQGHFGKVYAMHWASDSVHLVSASQDGKLIIWDGSTTRKEQAIPLRSSWVMTCAYDQAESPNMVACGGLDNVCSIYSLNQTQVMRATKELTRHDGYLSCCRFVGNDQMLTASGDSTCIHWDIEASTPLMFFAEHQCDVMSVATSPRDRSMFASGSVDASVKVWDFRTGKSTHTFDKYHNSDINSVAFFPEGYSVGTGSDDSSCRLFDVRCYGEVAHYSNNEITVGITSVSFSRSGRLFFAGYDDYKVRVWDTATNENRVLEGHDDRVSCLGVTPDGNAMCTGSWDTLLKVWA